MRVFLKIVALIGLIIIAILLLAAAKTFTPKHADVPANDSSTVPTATSTDNTNTDAANIDAINAAITDDLIHVTFPQGGDKIASPLKVTGQARGGWYFEASFPITVVNWDGLIIGEGHAQAKGDWMTTDFVPFEGMIIFAKPECAAGADYCKHGAIIFKNDNPSGQASTSYSVEIPVNFN
jgi:hypothetical protein